ncbi:hypothetical protein PVAP13_2NG371400 [Panicum virgatum]|uniref:Uncharacterized protein n=1 Tax=Panicum virgatum TaxID=38727 RepID=A0A8T0VW94_PANVG|nr:hypothetical protein PVAP13_2NG371400 [Panicum virgatum]KAG2635709.1 hypothetical protein PVAP13_2NG371400 [Panicum virgatum]
MRRPPPHAQLAGCRRPRGARPRLTPARAHRRERERSRRNDGRGGAQASTTLRAALGRGERRRAPHKPNRTAGVRHLGRRRICRARRTHPCSGPPPHRAFAPGNSVAWSEQLGAYAIRKARWLLLPEGSEPHVGSSHLLRLARAPAVARHRSAGARHDIGFSNSTNWCWGLSDNNRIEFR